VGVSPVRKRRASVPAEVAMTQGLSVTQVARRVVDEHDDLRRLLAQVEAAFGRPEPHAGSGPDVVAARLDTLRGPLRAHFDETERAGVFERIQERAPQHAHTCARLRKEHQSLIHLLDALRTASPLERRGQIWPREVRRFVAELVRHEARETALLNGALGELLSLAD
jgi:hemerythrin-like domain-containing protein